MKKLNIILLLLTFPVFLFAQNINSEKIVEDKVKENKSLGANFLIGAGFFNPNFVLSNINTSIPFDAKIAKGLYCELDFMINKRTNFSISTGAYFDTVMARSIDSNSRKTYQQTHRYIPLSLNFKYSFMEVFKTKIQPTIGVGIGGLNSIRKSEISNNSIFFSTSAGLGYMITKKLGIWMIARRDYHFINSFNSKLISLRGYEVSGSASYNINFALSVKL
jgi:hypothetical protein